MSLRLGVVCAVVDDEGRVLLSQRDDLNVWNLPGGRLDAHEALVAAAAREVREETGIIAHVERPVNLYYWAGFQRMNVLFAGWPLGGELQARTDETRDNQYFTPDTRPKMLNGSQVAAVLGKERQPMQTITMSPADMRRLQRKLSLRWIQNLLRGQPELRFPQFDVRAVAVIRDTQFRRVLTIENQRGRALPRVRCSGQEAPWAELTNRLKQHCGVNVAVHWVGVWQDTARDVLEFVFAATMPEKALKRPAEWSLVLNTPLSDRDFEYVDRVKPTFVQDTVWVMLHEDDLGDDDMILSGAAGA
jgi:ADP-ribose pyrophosphatase YjhB (NUDIX family)